MEELLRVPIDIIAQQLSINIIQILKVVTYPLPPRRSIVTGRAVAKNSLLPGGYTKESWVQYTQFLEGIQNLLYE